VVSASVMHIDALLLDSFYGVQGKFLKIFEPNRGRPDQEGSQIAQIGKPGRRFASAAATDFFESGKKESRKWDF
jgi:hypothetical protein